MAIILADIGNTKIKISINNNKDESFLLTRSFIKISYLYKFLNHMSKKYNISDFVFCSVRGKQTLVILENIKKILPSTNIIRISYYNKHFSFNYEPIESYGEDRLALLYYIASKFKNKPVFAIDSGTAITIETMNQLNYEGGLIFAGINTTLKALFSKTKQLPLLKDKLYLDTKNIDKFNIEKFGFSTQDSIMFGLYNFYKGSLINSFNMFYNKIKNLNSRSINTEKPIILITGGDCKLINHIIKNTLSEFEILIDENAVLKGLYYFYKSSKTE